MGPADPSEALAAHEAAIREQAEKLRAERVVRRAERPDVAFAMPGSTRGEADVVRGDATVSLARRVVMLVRWLRDRERVGDWMRAVVRLPWRLRQLEAQIDGLRAELGEQARELEALRAVVARLGAGEPARREGAPH
jgi:hypothetical protein